MGGINYCIALLISAGLQKAKTSLKEPNRVEQLKWLKISEIRKKKLSGTYGIVTRLSHGVTAYIATVII